MSAVAPASLTELLSGLVGRSAGSAGGTAAPQAVTVSDDSAAAFQALLAAHVTAAADVAGEVRAPAQPTAPSASGPAIPAPAGRTVGVTVDQGTDTPASPPAAPATPMAAEAPQTPGAANTPPVTHAAAGAEATSEPPHHATDPAVSPRQDLPGPAIAAVDRPAPDTGSDTDIDDDTAASSPLGQDLAARAVTAAAVVIDTARIRMDGAPAVPEGGVNLRPGRAAGIEAPAGQAPRAPRAIADDDDEIDPATLAAVASAAAPAPAILAPATTAAAPLTFTPDEVVVAGVAQPPAAAPALPDAAGAGRTVTVPGAISFEEAVSAALDNPPAGDDAVLAVTVRAGNDGVVTTRTRQSVVADQAVDMMGGELVARMDLPVGLARPAGRTVAFTAHTDTTTVATGRNATPDAAPVSPEPVSPEPAAAGTPAPAGRPVAPMTGLETAPVIDGPAVDRPVTVRATAGGTTTPEMATPEMAAADTTPIVAPRDVADARTATTAPSAETKPAPQAASMAETTPAGRDVPETATITDDTVQAAPARVTTAQAASVPAAAGRSAAATAQAPTMQAPTMQAPTTQAAAVQAPTVQAPTVQAPAAEVQAERTQTNRVQAAETPAAPAPQTARTAAPAPAPTAETAAPAGNARAAGQNLPPRQDPPAGRTEMAAAPAASAATDAAPAAAARTDRASEPMTARPDAAAGPRQTDAEPTAAPRSAAEPAREAANPRVQAPIQALPAGAAALSAMTSFDEVSRPTAAGGDLAAAMGLPETGQFRTGWAGQTQALPMQDAAPGRPAMQVAQHMHTALAGSMSPAGGMPLAGGESHFVMTLMPADLGRVRVEMKIDAQGRISARFSAEKPEAVDALSADAGDLERSLTQAGFKIEPGALRYDVDRSLANQAGGQQMAGQQGSGQQGQGFAGQNFAGQGFNGMAGDGDRRGNGAPRRDRDTNIDRDPLAGIGSLNGLAADQVATIDGRRVDMRI
ncbi:flagellar hook-length control protein FliK [Tistrella mobilis]|uniref:flagellar hook-length control protein FliK n=1 Tax=Tistrella mobilis TaxID=171437 RepID=UPI0031F6DCF2